MSAPTENINTAPPHYDNPAYAEMNSNSNEKSIPPQNTAQAPPQGMPQQAQFQPQRTNYQIATPLASLQQGPAPVDCPACGVREMTRTEFVSGGTTHLSAALCCFCFCLGCIPYLASWFKDCEHKCGNCGALLAVWHRSGRTEVMAHRAA